jgi:arylsulfatase A-like enzyme
MGMEQFGTILLFGITLNQKKLATITDQKLRFDGGDYQAVGGYSTDNYTKYAKDFIEKSHDKPWVLWLCYDGVHAPHTPAKRHLGAYDNAEPIEIPKDVFPPRPTKPTYMQNYAMLTPDKDGVPIANRLGIPLPKLVQKYQSAALSIDEGIGEIMESLRATGALENTVVVLTSDQGLAMGHHGMTIKVAPYDDNIRTPLIIKLPGEKGGKVSRIPVQGLDLIPTFFELAGINLPWEMNGKSLIPLLKKPEKDWNRPVVLENFSMKFGSETDSGITDSLPNQGIDWWISFREGKYKYIRTLRENEIEELYDLDRDPKELENLASLPEYSGQLKTFRKKLEAQLRDTGAELVNNWPEPRGQ